MSDTDNLLEAFEYLEKYTEAVILGTQKFVSFLPIMVHQQIENLAGQRLNSTRDRFLQAIQQEEKDNLLIITVDPEDWVAVAVEAGASPFDMKAKHLNSPKAKVSKEGFRYMVIPMGKKKNAHPGNNQKGMFWQDIINKELTKPKFKPAKMSLGIDGNLRVMEEVINKSQLARGLYRTRTFKDSQSFHSGGRASSSSYVMFRVMSEKFPEKWQHPGIAPANIFKDTEAWLMQNIAGSYTQFINNELDKI